MLHRNFRVSQRGSHILEFSLVVPILLVLILAAFDINSAMQSYTALQEGVKKALRCSYTTDGDCVQTSPDPRDRLFDVTRLNPRVKYVVNRRDYQGETAWFNFPVYQYSSAQANVVGSISYTAPSMLEPRGGPVSYYLLTHRLPYVSGNDPLNPSFTIGPNGPAYPEISAPLSVNGTTDSTDGVGIGRSRNFTIPLSASPPCYVATSTLETRNEPVADFSRNCNLEKAHIMIHIRGRTASGQGTVQIELDSDNDEDDRPLGGRATGGGNANFAVRGFIRESCTSASTQNNRDCDYAASAERIPDAHGEESFLHANVKVSYNTPFRIRFRLVSHYGDPVTWSGDDIRIFTSTFEHKTDEANCLRNVDPGSPLSPCPSNHPSGQMIPSPKPKGPAVAAGPMALNNPECNPNYGLPPGASLADCIAACGVIVPESATGVRCNIVSKSIAATARVAIEDCTQLPITKDKLGPPFSDYHDLVLGAPTVVDTNPVYTRSIDPEKHPSELKALPQFSCNEAQPFTRKYVEAGDPGENSASVEYIKLNYPSLLTGPQIDLGCDYESKLRTAAESLKPEHKTLPGAYFDAPQGVFAGMPIEVDNKPTDSCTPYDMKVMDEGPREHLGTFASNAIPAGCQNGDWICQIKFLGYTGGQGGETNLDLQLAAEKYAEPVIQAAFPSANFSEQCRAGEDYCTSVVHDDLSTDKTQPFFRASMEVPLILPKIIGQDTFRISYEDSHKVERIYSK